MKYVILILTCLPLSLSGCSYLMDSIEGAITERASFKATAQVAANGTDIDFTWEKSGGDSFAGYEIYVTEEPDNEFAGYRTLAATYDLNTVPANTVLSSLETASTSSATVPNAASSLAGHIYFFRVGHIEWKETTEIERIAKWTIANGYLYNWPPANETQREYFYKLCTSLEKISGFVMLEL